MKKLFAGLLVASAAVTSAHAETWYLKSYARALSEASYWKNAAGLPATQMSKDDEYVVSKTGLRAHSDTFAGGHLSIGTAGGKDYSSWILHEGHANLVNCTLNCGYLANYHSTTVLNLDGRIEVASPKSAPFGFHQFSDTYINDMNVTGTLVGDETVGIVIGGKFDGSAFEYKSSGANYFTCRFNDLSQYKGDIHVLSSNAVNEAETAFRMALFQKTTSTGSIEVDIGGIVRADGATVTVGGLTLHGGSRLVVRNASDTVGQFVVTGTFVKDGDEKVQVRVLNRPAVGIDPLRIPVLTVPATQGLDVNDFEFLDDGGAPTVEEDESAGTKTLAVYYPSIITVTANDGGGYTDATADSGTSFTNAACFSDGKLPHSFADYTMTGGKINTPWEEDYVFPGLSYTIRAGATATMLFCGGSATFADLVWNSSNTQIYVPNGMSPTLKGRVTVDGKAVLMLYNNSVFTVDAELRGGGTWFFSGNVGTSSPQAMLVFNGINTNWFGQIDVAMVKRVFDKPSKYTDFPCLTIYHRIQFADGRSLGGALPEFRYDSIRLGGYTALQPLATTTLDAANRGILVDEAAQVFTGEGVELSCRMPITMNGTLYKTLPGTLALGGGVRFLAEGALTDEPPADVALRTLVVTNGCVKALTHDCVNGLRVDLAANHDTSLAIDFDPQDANLRRYGFYNVKTSDPFTTKAGEKIHIRLANLDTEALRAARRTDAGFKQGLVTVKTEEVADALDGILALERPEGVPLHLMREDDAESGLTTFSAFSKETGLQIIVR